MFRKAKKGLVAVVGTLALSGVMAAMSYSSATVASDMEVSVVDTDKALLALSPSDEHYAAFLGKSSATDVLKIDLDKGLGNQDFGIQPHSTYEWDDLFTVTNNSEHTVEVTIDAETMTSNRVFVNVSTDGVNWSELSGSRTPSGTVKGDLTFDLAPGASQDIHVQTVTPNSKEGTKELKLNVSGEKK